MFTHAVKYLLLLLMSAHGIFGCCWHHGHSCASDVAGCDVEVACNENYHHGYEHQEGLQHAHDDDVAPDQESSHDEACNEETCVYVHVSKAQGQYQVAFELALDQAFSCGIQRSAASATVFATPGRFDPLAQTTGERCARLQTWLI